MTTNQDVGVRALRSHSAHARHTDHRVTSPQSETTSGSGEDMRDAVKKALARMTKLVEKTNESMTKVQTFLEINEMRILAAENELAQVKANHQRSSAVELNKILDDLRDRLAEATTQAITAKRPRN